MVFYEENKVRAIISEMVNPLLRSAKDNINLFNK
jgi:hypothetical protein